MKIDVPPIAQKISVVEQYIYKKKGVKVNIIFNNPFMLDQHLRDLDYAYLIANEEDNRSREASKEDEKKV
jgi:hypothetical protein